MKFISTFGLFLALAMTAAADTQNGGGLRKLQGGGGGGNGGGGGGNGGGENGGGGGGNGGGPNGGGGGGNGGGGGGGNGGGENGGGGGGTGGDGNNNNNDINDPPTASPIDMLPTDPTIRIPVTGSLNELRFNKVLFENNNVPIAASTLLPLLPEDFPLSSVVNEDTVNLLRQSLSWSVIAEDDCHQCEYPFSELITAVGGLPTHPDINDPNNGYWEELWDVIEARRLRLLKASPISVLQQIPAVWAGYSLDDMADAVHNEYPGKNQAALIETFIGLGVPVDEAIIPSVNVVDFLRYEILLAELNTWSIGMVGPSNFGLKFSGGRARPEEIVWFLKYAQVNRVDELATWGVPVRILNSIERMELTHPHDFTAYSEGSPTHPSWPAMHSAASVASFWLAVVLNLSKEQRCEAMALDYAVSYGRTIAGVHFPTDNTAGLNLGQQLLIRELPEFLVKKFGADVNDEEDYRAVIQAKIATLEHDWENYPNGECFRQE